MSPLSDSHLWFVCLVEGMGVAMGEEGVMEARRGSELLFLCCSPYALRQGFPLA